MHHVLSCDQFTRPSLEQLFTQTDELQADVGKYSSALTGKIVATIFYEPSTRTRLSFEAAVTRLGGNVISTENAKEMSSAIKGESLLDTIRVVAGYCDAIVLRHSDSKSAVEAASVSAVPIINAGSGSGEHPTQALLDAYTIYQHKQSLDGLNVAVLGDLLFGRTVHSLVKLLTLYEDVTIYGLSREVLALPDEYVTFLTKQGVRYVACNSFGDIPAEVDVLYHTRTQTERFQNSDLHIEEFVIDQSVLNSFSPQTILMHPLPRRHEISPEVDQDNRAVFFQQSHLGMYVRMALLYNLLSN